MAGELGILSADFRVNTQLISAPASIQVLAQDPSRWGLIFSACFAGQNVWVSPTPDVSSNKGILLASQTPYIMFNFRDFGAMISGQWFAFGAAGSNLYIVETLYRPVEQLIVTEEDMDNLAAKLERGDVLVGTTQAPSLWERQRGRY